ncbi:MAG: hypothetical protein RML72_02615 [Bacteroidia bacterium]|nr:hypothetical protein [Bacteroidia bacterium]MDW8157754.1 hypothetical protein [Bacteroidia bacterium]
MLKRSIFTFKHIHIAITLPILYLWLSGCKEEPQNTTVLPPSQSVENVKLDILRLEPRFKAAYQKLDTLRFKNCSQIYDEFFKDERLFLASWVSGEPIRFFQKISNREIDEGLTSELCAAVANRDNRRLVDSVLKVYPENYDFQKLLSPLFTQLKSYWPEYPIPKIRFMATGYDPRKTWEDNFFESSVYVGDGYIAISSDYFLGEKFTIRHPDTPLYIRKRCTPTYLTSMVAHRLAENLLPQLKNSPTLLDLMIHQGIKYYIVDILLPETEDTIKFFMTKQQAEWLNKNKANVYHELIPMLYETKMSKFRKYLSDGGYCAAIGTFAPSRLATFIGLEIVRSYMNAHPQTQLKELVAIRDYKTFFEKSNYKP